VRRWPGNALFARIQHVFEDGVIDEQERADLAALMSQLVGGKISMVIGADGPTTLPVDDPAPPIEWNENVFVMTGRFAYGTRAVCEQEIVSRGGQLAANVTKRTTYLVLGTFGSDDWSHSSYGRKIERACELKSAGSEIYIVTEDHWAGAL
jgi:NAD-dependent DNA ligase